MFQRRRHKDLLAELLTGGDLVVADQALPRVQHGDEVGATCGVLAPSLPGVQHRPQEASHAVPGPGLVF